MTPLVIPHRSSALREPWWMAPVGFVVVAAFMGASVALWFVEALR